MPEDAQYDRNM